MDDLGPPILDPSTLVLPPGSRLDPVTILDVATRTNAAHAALGTELLGIGPATAAIRLAFRPALAGPGVDRWANGVLAAMLDHVCSLTGVVTLGDPARFGGTMGLRVEYGPPAVGVPVLVARAHGEVVHGGVLRVAGVVHAPRGAGAPGAPAAPDVVFAHARCTVAVAR